MTRAARTLAFLHLAWPCRAVCRCTGPRVETPTSPVLLEVLRPWIRGALVGEFAQSEAALYQMTWMV
jgi:hypothetical protein